MSKGLNAAYCYAEHSLKVKCIPSVQLKYVTRVTGVAFGAMSQL